MMQVIQYDNRWQLSSRGTLTLVCDVRKILTQLFTGFVVHIEGCDASWSQLLTRPGKKSRHHISLLGVSFYTLILNNRWISIKPTTQPQNLTISEE